MKIVINNSKVEIKRIDGLGTLISDADVNKIIYSKVFKSKKGKLRSKESIVDVKRPVKIKDLLFFPLLEDMDDCYFNNEMAFKK
jgi:hypothetical protein